MAVIRTCLKLLAVGLLISAVAVRADDDDEEEGDADAGASVGTVIGIDLGESANKEPAKRVFSCVIERVCVRRGACET